MDLKKHQTKIIKSWGDIKEGEDISLTETKVQIDDFSKDNAHPCCGVTKSVLRWKNQNPKKALLIGVAFIMFLFGITSFIIMNKMLGKL